MPIRPARQADQPTIRRIIRQAGINPFGIDWPRFVVAEENGQIVGVGQIKPHGDGSRELASLAVIPERQGAGIGTAVVRALLAGENGPLYLMCARRMEAYYQHFGFRRIPPAEMPPYFRRMHRIANLGTWRQPRLIVMRRPGQVGRAVQAG